MRIRTAFAVALPGVVMSVVLLAGCALLAPASPTSTPTIAATTSPSSSPSPSPSTPAPASPGATTDPNAPANQCTNTDLTVTVAPDAGGGAAGSLYSTIVFTNTGSTSCALRGVPGVSVVGNGDQTQLGAAAESTAVGVPPTVTLLPGGKAKAPLQATNIASGGGPLGDSCAVHSGDGYRIYPPHSFDAIFVSAPKVPACTTAVVWLHVGAVAAG